MGVEEKEEDRGNRSTDSIRGGHYQRSNSVSDPLCVSTPKAYKTRLLQRRSVNVDLSEEEVSKRGTLTSMSSSSSASPPSTDTSRSGRDEHSSDSIPSLLRARKANTSRSLSSLLSDSKSSVAPLELATPEAKVVMASKASRLLKSVRLMLARERSYDVSQAEEGKRGREASKTAYQHRCSGSPGPCCPDSSGEPVATGPVLRPLVRRTSSGATAATRTSSRVTVSGSCDKNGSGLKVQAASRKPSFGSSQGSGGSGTRQQLVREERGDGATPRDSNAACKEEKKMVGSYSKNEQAVRMRRNKAELERIEMMEEEETDVDAVSCRRERPASEDVLDKEVTVMDQERVREEEKENLRKLKLLHTPEIQSFPIHKVTLVPERESLRAKLVSSKMVKRSRSFNRIFSYSMLGRSKEYRL